MVLIRACPHHCRIISLWHHKIVWFLKITGHSSSLTMNVHFETISTSRGKQNVWKQVLVAVSKKERKEVIKIKNGKEFYRIVKKVLTNLVRDFLDTIKSPNVIQCVNGRWQTTMKAKYLQQQKNVLFSTKRNANLHPKSNTFPVLLCSRDLLCFITHSHSLFTFLNLDRYVPHFIPLCSV